MCSQSSARLEDAVFNKTSWARGIGLGHLKGTNWDRWEGGRSTSQGPAQGPEAGPQKGRIAERRGQATVLTGGSSGQRVAEMPGQYVFCSSIQVLSQIAELLALGSSKK